jgi:hypothetical protein
MAGGNQPFPIATCWRNMIGAAGADWLEGAVMTSIAAGDGAQLGPAAENLARRRTSGIYGAIITAAILDTVGGRASTTVLVISVVGTLLVYWIAEEYAEVLGEHTAGGRLPSRASIQGALAATWPMVSASFAPLLAVVLATLAGTSSLTAANVGLVVAMALLTIHGWLAGRAAQLRGWKLLVATSIAAGLGLVMILLKDLVLIHLH